jgi:hypothetical protein
MPRTCTVCTHPDKAEIDRLLLEGKPFRYVAAQYGTSTSALVRHKANDILLVHIPTHRGHRFQTIVDSRSD